MTRVAVEFHELASRAGFDLLPEAKMAWLSPRGHLNPVVKAGVSASVLTALRCIFNALGGDERRLAARSRGAVKADFLWAARSLVIEVDEIQHFTRYRAETFRYYPSGVKLAFAKAAYVQLCNQLCERAEKAYAHVVVQEFPGALSRARQRAYNDCVRDLCTPFFTAGPVLRIPAPERNAGLVLSRFRQLTQSVDASIAPGGRRIVKNYANPVIVRPRRT